MLFGNRISRLVGFLLVGVIVAVLNGNVCAQSVRGFPTNTVVDLILGHWQSMQEQLREDLAPLQKPEFDFELLRDAPSEPSADVLARKTLAALPSRLVIVMGGLQGSRLSAEKFAAALHQTCRVDTQYAVFVYPNDGSIEASAEVLHTLLKYIQDCAPRTRITLVAHSMGGLVARQCLECCACSSDNARLPSVDRLIMICPPNHGSVLAQYADALEFSDALAKMKSGNQSVRGVIKSVINDGLGEACEELVPNSDFLRRLNERPRAAGIHYSIIAGTGGLITPLVRLAAATVVDESFSRTRISQFSNASDMLLRANELLTSDEFARGCGDGAVSVKSAQLPGVEEFCQLDMFHSEWADIEKPHVQTLVKLVIDSLEKR